MIERIDQFHSGKFGDGASQLGVKRFIENAARHFESASFAGSRVQSADRFR